MAMAPASRSVGGNWQRTRWWGSAALAALGWLGLRWHAGQQEEEGRGDYGELAQELELELEAGGFTAVSASPSLPLYLLAAGDDWRGSKRSSRRMAARV
jgi:hypothetical protein